MSNIKKDKILSALEAVHGALKPLKPEEIERVLTSVRALLEIPPESQTLSKGKPAPDSQLTSTPQVAPSSTRPLAIRELIQDKKPTTHPEFITLFAYYREKYENLPTFEREDLRQYYKVSRENPPANFDRDFVAAVTRGWIHEQSDNSYITSKGIEAVESGFAAHGHGNSPSNRRSAAPRGARRTSGK